MLACRVNKVAAELVGSKDIVFGAFLISLNFLKSPQYFRSRPRSYRIAGSIYSCAGTSYRRARIIWRVRGACVSWRRVWIVWSGWIRLRARDYLIIVIVELILLENIWHDTQEIWVKDLQKGICVLRLVYINEPQVIEYLDYFYDRDATGCVSGHESCCSRRRGRGSDFSRGFLASL